jgi:hypothetical protein
MRIPQLWIVDLELDLCFSVVVKIRRPMEDFLSIEARAEVDFVSSIAFDRRDDFAAHFRQACVHRVVDTQIFDASIVALQADFFPRPAGRQDWAPVPATTNISLNMHVDNTSQDSQMILRLPRRQPSHITVEANPFMFRMRVLYLLSLSQSRLEVDFQHIATSLLQLLGDVNAMVDEHVVAFENRLAIELDGGVGVESIECEDVLDAT